MRERADHPVHVVGVEFKPCKSFILFAVPFTLIAGNNWGLETAFLLKAGRRILSKSSLCTERVRLFSCLNLASRQSSEGKRKHNSRFWAPDVIRALLILVRACLWHVEAFLGLGSRVLSEGLGPGCRGGWGWGARWARRAEARGSSGQSVRGSQGPAVPSQKTCALGRKEGPGRSEPSRQKRWE